MSVKTFINDGKHRHSLLPGHAWAVHEGFVNPGDLEINLVSQGVRIETLFVKARGLRVHLEGVGKVRQM